MTYNVSMGTLNPTIPIKNEIIIKKHFQKPFKQFDSFFAKWHSMLNASKVYDHQILYRKRNSSFHTKNCQNQQRHLQLRAKNCVVIT